MKKCKKICIFEETKLFYMKKYIGDNFMNKNLQLKIYDIISDGDS